MLALSICVPPQAETVGLVMLVSNATAGGISLTKGMTVYVGDVISVAPGGSLQIGIPGAGRVFVNTDSQARILKEAGQFKLEVLAGSAWFYAGVKQVEGRLADAVIHSAGNSPAIASITMKRPDFAIVMAEKGSILVATTHDGKSVTLQEGQAVEVTVEYKVKNGPPEKDPRVMSNRAVAILGAIVIGGISAITFKAGPPLSGATVRQVISPFTP